MKISVDVYTTDVQSATATYVSAIEAGATDVRLMSSEDYESGEFEYINLMFEAEHTCKVLDELDSGPFVKDSRDL